MPGQDKKIKFVMMMDMATRYKVTETLFAYPHGECPVETSEQLIRVLTLRWLMDKPRPKIFIPDNANTLTSKTRLTDFLSVAFATAAINSTEYTQG